MASNPTARVSKHRGYEDGTRARREQLERRRILWHARVQLGTFAQRVLHQVPRGCRQSDHFHQGRHGARGDEDQWQQGEHTAEHQ